MFLTITIGFLCPIGAIMEFLLKKENLGNKVLLVGAEISTIIALIVFLKSTGLVLLPSQQTSKLTAPSNTTSSQVSDRFNNFTSIASVSKEIATNGVHFVASHIPNISLESILGTESIILTSSETILVNTVLNNMRTGSLELPQVKDTNRYTCGGNPYSLLNPGDKIKFERLDNLSVEARLLASIASNSSDFAIQYFDFNQDGVKDFFLELKANNQFYLYLCDGQKMTFELITLQWPRAGSLKCCKDGYVLSSAIEDGVLCCNNGDYERVWLGFVGGKIQSVEYSFFEELEESNIVCDNDWFFTVEEVTPKWSFVSVHNKNKVRLIVLPTSAFKSQGFIWGNNVNVRSSPDKGNNVCYQLNNGAVVNIHEIKGDWVRLSPCFSSLSPNSIKYDDPQWVHSDYVKHIPPFKKKDVPDIKTKEKAKEVLLRMKKALVETDEIMSTTLKLAADAEKTGYDKIPKSKVEMAIEWKKRLPEMASSMNKAMMGFENGEYSKDSIALLEKEVVKIESVVVVLRNSNRGADWLQSHLNSLKNDKNVDETICRYISNAEELIRDMVQATIYNKYEIRKEDFLGRFEKIKSEVESCTINNYRQSSFVTSSVCDLKCMIDDSGVSLAELENFQYKAKKFIDSIPQDYSK